MHLRSKDLTRLVALVLALTGASCAGQPESTETTEDDTGSARSAVLSAQQQQKLLSSDIKVGDQLGNAVAISGDTLVVGAFADDTIDGSPLVNQGSVYVFVKVNGQWVEQQRLIASDGTSYDNFGQSVAIDGDTIAVGVPHDDIGTATDQGSVYVFTRSNGVWSQQQKLTASDGVWFNSFGLSVALSGDTLITGADQATVNGMGTRGCAYVFTRSGGAWTQAQKLIASDGNYYDRFGYSVAMDGDTAIIGAREDSGAWSSQGSAYLFTRTAGVWSQQQKINASDASDYAFFGDKVAVSGGTAIVGAPWDASKKGAAYVFTSSNGVWSQQQKLTASDGTANELFGSAVALSGDIAMFGLAADDIAGKTDQGSAYLFQRANGTFTEQQKLVASDAAAGDQLGVSVALGAGVALTGAFTKNLTTNGSQGAAYVYSLSSPNTNGTACSAAADCASGFCVDGRCCDSACGGGLTDCQACSVAAGAAVNGTCGPVAAATMCRASSGACDVAETCDGASTACPADAKAPPTTVCRSASQACDVAEYCDGTNDACPADSVVSAGTICRSSAGSCDVADACDGAGKDCPADAKAAAGTVCRAPANACDPAETCDGASNACPADVPSGACGGTPVCVTIQRGVNGAVMDSYLSSGNGSWAPGAYPWMTTGGSSIGRALLWFDLSSIPAGATVTSAAVTLYVHWNPSNTTVRAHEVLNPWSESTVSYTNFWSSSNFDAAVASSFVPNVMGLQSLDITSLAAAWVSGAAVNNGFLLEEDIGQAAPYGKHDYFGSETSSTSQRPKLDICYVQ